MSFTETLKQLPKISHLAAIKLLNNQGEEIGLIENKPGQAGSLAIYNHLAQIYGAITPDAAKKGVELYAEHSEDALAHPGKHPNIDRLLRIKDASLTLQVKQVFAV